MRRRHRAHIADTVVALSALASAFSLVSCAPISVPPQPIDPTATAGRLTARSLQDTQITDALTREGISPASGWTLDALTVAAWNLRSDIAAAVSDVTTGTAAERVAGLVPNPSVGFDPAYLVDNASGNLSPWTIATAISFTIETAGKREIRVAAAQADTTTRRWRLAETLWQARADLRRSLVARALGLRSVALAEDELRLRQAYADWVETQIRFGLGIGPDRLVAQSNLSHAQSQLRAARGELTTAEAQIAAAAGIAIENLPLGQLVPVAFETLPPPDANDLGTLRDWVLTNRLSVRHALADYAVTEQALRLAVAQQYPDVTIGPGYTFDRGDHAFTLSAGATIPLFHDERDSIAQAVDVRSHAGTLFEAAQAQALGDIDTALARYRAAYAALTEARSAEAIAQRAAGEVQRRLTAGGADRGELLTAQIALALAQRATLDALRTVVDALGALEDGVQRPVWPNSTLALARPDAPPTEGTK